MSYYVHPSAIVDPGAKIGEGTHIWHFVHISENAEIGSNVSIGQGSYVAKTSIIGNGCKIQNNVSVYDGVVLENDVFCGPSVVFTNVYNPRAFVSRKSEYRSTIVKNGATLGANCTIICGVTIGEFAFIAAGAVINRDVPDYALMAGVPARLVGWMSAHGERLDLPESGNGDATCKATGIKYELRNGICSTV